MNYIISITNPNALNRLLGICDELGLSPPVIMYGCGTAAKSVLDLLGIDSKERRVVFTAADDAKTREFLYEQRKRLYLDAPGNGVAMSIPIKSVGGELALSYLGGDGELKGAPELKPGYELILSIINEGHSETVLDAARAAGARGATILHGRGTGSKSAEKFFKVTIAQEKEVIFIVSKSDQKSAIMSAILKSAGPNTDAGAIVFSLPVNDIAGFGLI